MSIYSIANFTSTTYNTNDIVRYPSNTNNFYYCLTDGVDGSSNTPSISSSVWGGLSSFNGILKPKFIWKTNYGITAQHEPKTLNINFEGYSARVITDLNNDLLKLDLSFDLRGEKETAAIIHFLYARASAQSFLFTPSPPHDLEKLFVCRQWSDTYIFYGNHSLRAVFEEIAS